MSLPPTDDLMVMFKDMTKIFSFQPDINYKAWRRIGIGLGLPSKAPMLGKCRPVRRLQLSLQA